MKDLRLDNISYFSYDELLDLKKEILKNTTERSKKLQDAINQLFDYNIGNFTGELNLDNNIKKRVKNLFKQIKKTGIYSIDFDSLYNIFYTKQLTLNSIANEVCSHNSYIKELIKISKIKKSIVSIKIYDFYDDLEDNEFKKMIEKLKKNNFFQRLIANIKENNNKVEIQILTNLNSDYKYDLYKMILEEHDFENITIKHIPTSTSLNVYIPNLFFTLIKYRTLTSNNKISSTYKYAVAYLEPNTNFAVVNSSYLTTKTTLSNFIKLLDVRFDEQFKNSIYNFNPKDKLSDEDFEKDIDNILKEIDNLTQSNDINLNNNILKEINLLKIKYKSINYAYKLLKAHYYYVSYLSIIKNVTKTDYKPHTLYIVDKIISNKYYKKFKDLAQKIKFNNLKITLNKKSVDIKRIRKVIIEEINNKKAICDIFPDKNWLVKETIIKNFNDILKDRYLLDKFFHEIDYSIPDEKKESFFKDEIITKILLGKKIIL